MNHIPKAIKYIYLYIFFFVIYIFYVFKSENFIIEIRVLSFQFDIFFLISLYSFGV